MHKLRQLQTEHCSIVVSPRTAVRYVLVRVGPGKHGHDAQDCFSNNLVFAVLVPKHESWISKQQERQRQRTTPPTRARHNVGNTKRDDSNQLHFVWPQTALRQAMLNAPQTASNPF